MLPVILRGTAENNNSVKKFFSAQKAIIIGGTAMLENISRAITTALFFLCTAIVGGIEPAESAPAAETCQPIAAETSIDKYSDFSLV